MLKSQEKDVYDTIIRGGFSPKDFEWTTVETSQGTGKVPMIRYTGGESNGAFVFDQNAVGVRVCRYAPGRETVNVNVHTAGWDGVLVLIRDWLRNLRREIDTPDVWAALESERQMIDSAISHTPQEDNAPFSPAELERVRNSIESIRKSVEGFEGMVQDKAERIDKHLDYLIDASRRMGRKDWTILAATSFYGLALAIALPPDSARALVQLAPQALSWLTGSPPPLLGP